MDGNRRFAKSLNLNPSKGHEYGEKKVFLLLDWCLELKIQEITIYAFSAQNKNRPKIEFNYLMKLFLNAANKILKDEKKLNSGVKIKIIGDIKIFPETVQKKLNELEEKTKQNKKYKLNIALGYGGREEIIHSVKKIANQIKKGTLKPENITEKTINKELYLQTEPDLIIRTGGDHRTSNFLPWQSIYSEWFFLEKKWPEFEKEDLKECINQYAKRERRFGK